MRFDRGVNPRQFQTDALPPLQPSDGMILVIGPRLEGRSVIFLAIQTHLSMSPFANMACARWAPSTVASSP